MTDNASPLLPERAADWRAALASLEHAFEQIDAELALVRAIDRAILDDRLPLDLRQLTDFVLHQLLDVFSADGATLYHVRGNSLAVAGHVGAEWPSPWFESLEGSEKASSTRQTGQLRSGDGRVLGEFASAPIRPHHHSVSVLALWTSRKDGFSTAETTFLSDIARQLRIAYTKAHVLPEATLLQRLDDLFFSGLPERAAVQTLLSEISRHFTSLPDHAADRVQILFPVGDEGALEIVSSTQPDDIGLRVSRQSVCGEALNTGKTVVIDDVIHAPLYRSFLGDDIRSECAVPILVGKKAIAVFNVESTQTAFFGGYAAYFIEQYVKQLRFLLAFARVREDVVDRVEVDGADEVFTMMAGAAADLLHQVNNKLSSLKVRLAQLNEANSADEQAALITRCISLADAALAAPEAMKARLLEIGAPEVNDAIRRVVGGMESEFETVHFDLERLSSDLPSVRTFLLHEVLDNVVRNAAKAIRDSGRVGTVTIESRRRKKGADAPVVDIVIRDDGPGMSADQQASLFELGVEKRPGGGGGSGWGFGMYFVDKAVRRVNGTITIRSSVGAGTEVLLTFPTRNPSHSIEGV